jgi:acetyltransferase-like isoleucine patch superfamily enzyme
MNDLLLPKIHGTIHANHQYIGRGVIVEDDVLITGRDGPADIVILGDFCYIGRHTRISVPEFRLGDYSKLHAFSYANGDLPLRIGRNCWIGGNTVLDSMGGLDINDNVGIGAHSQVWSHIQFGDIVEGCRFFSKKKVTIESDAWFVGHCIVSPIAVGQKSMAFAGSVITKDMLSNRVYAGVPAVDITDKVGQQFEERSVEEKTISLQKIIDDFVSQNVQYKNQLITIQSPLEIIEGITCFNLADRTYTKTYSSAEIIFLKHHIPLIKFTPKDEPPFIYADFRRFSHKDQI